MFRDETIIRGVERGKRVSVEPLICIHANILGCLLERWPLAFLPSKKRTLEPPPCHQLVCFLILFSCQSSQQMKLFVRGLPDSDISMTQLCTTRVSIAGEPTKKNINGDSCVSNLERFFLLLFVYDYRVFVSFVFLKHRCLCQVSGFALTSEALLNLTPSPPTRPRPRRDFWPLSQKLTFCLFTQFVCHLVNLQTAGVPALRWPPMAPHQVNSWPELCPRCEGSQESAPDMLYRPLRRGAYLLISAARISCTHGSTSAAKRAGQMQQRCKKSSWEQRKLPIRDLLDQTWTFFSPPASFRRSLWPANAPAVLFPSWFSISILQPTITSVTLRRHARHPHLGSARAVFSREADWVGACANAISSV